LCHIGTEQWCGGRGRWGVGGGQHLGLGGQGEGPLAEGLQEHFDVVPRVSVYRLRGRDSLSTRALLRNACRPFLSAELFALGASLCGTGEEETCPASSQGI
jgi:hypothetical protein